MPIRKRVAEVGDDVGEYLLALRRHWGPIVSGAVLGIASYVYGVEKNRAIPPNVYLLILVGAAIIAGFLAWRDEYKGRNDAEQLCDNLMRAARDDPRANLDALRRSVLFLSNEMNQFAQERNDTRPTISLLHLNTQTLHQRAEVEKGVAAHRHETLRLYYERFGARVSIARDDLAALTLTDARLDELYTAPAFNEEISEIAECLRLLAEQIPTHGADTPDVTLTGTFPGILFLCARGHVCEIRTGPIILESAVIGTLTDNGRTMREVSQHYAIEFPVVGDLGDGEKALAIPTLFCGEGYSRSNWPEKESGSTGMAEFFRMAAYIRRVKIGEPDTNTCTDAEINDFAERIRQELTFKFDITFWNSDHTQQWKRSELLVHEPTTGTAFVRHAGTPERLVGSVGARS